MVIDFNHPLAGKDLEVTFTVRQVREATPEDLEQQAEGHRKVAPALIGGRTGGLPPPH